MQQLQSGRHFLQIPGPTNVPDRILRAIVRPTIDHRGPEFKGLCFEVLEGIKEIFQTRQPVIIFPASGTGAWEAALVNTHSPGDRVLIYDTGHFASTWHKLATKLGLDVQLLSGSWREGVRPDEIEHVLAEDKDRTIKSLCVVHNDTATGITSDIPAIRKAIVSSGHNALFCVDTISSLGSIDYRHDDWGVDVTVGGSQKGLMLPPGLSFNAVSKRALEACEGTNLPRSYWDWQDMLNANKEGVFPYTPATNLLYGLREAVRILLEEGLDQVFSRHRRLADAARAAVKAWELELNALNPGEYSNSLTAVLLPQGHDSDEFRKVVLENFNVSLGNGLGRLSGKLFRIGHLGDFNDPMLLGTLGAIEMGLELAKIPHRPEGVRAAMNSLVENSRI
jgi:alanine-glyoxylate transaminase/serine-glyoxylate transaminase/serine-pyruvate transaminase